MKPFTTEAVQQLAGEERWQELFDRVIERVTAHPATIGKLTLAERQKLVNLILLMAGPNDAPVN